MVVETFMQKVKTKDGCYISNKQIKFAKKIENMWELTRMSLFYVTVLLVYYYSN